MCASNAANPSNYTMRAEQTPNWLSLLSNTIFFDTDYLSSVLGKSFLHKPHHTHSWWRYRETRTFMTSTCRSSCRAGVTLMASRIWLNNCFSGTSVSTATKQSSHRIFCQSHRTTAKHENGWEEHELTNIFKKNEHWSSCHVCKLNYKCIKCEWLHAKLATTMLGTHCKNNDHNFRSC